jgi:F420-dependent oxidoreductase-like protein
VRFGLEINEFDWPGGEREMGRHLGEIGRRAEDAGFDSLWVWDHFVQLRKWEDPLLEGWLMLAHLAAATKKAKLGTLVTGVTYRYPAILVKQATTLDVLSGGRAYFGVGAAWNEREHYAFGAPFPPLRERFEILEDTLQLAKRVWAGDRGAFDGKHVHLTEQIDVPAPVQKPHPPILIGGGGERKTLRLVAQYADATHCGSGPDNFRHKMEVLRKHCEDVGRDFEEIERCTGMDVARPDRRPGQLADGGLLLERVGDLSDVGAQALFVVLPKLADSDSIERFGKEVIEKSRDL